MLLYYGNRIEEALKALACLNSESVKTGGATNMYAVIKTGGKQYQVKVGDVVFIEKIEGKDGSKVKFDQVLAIGDEGKFTAGTPFVEGATVEGKILGQTKGKKIIIFKMKPKKGYRNKNGHRQPYTKVEIKKINA